jgi:hypothetical protein
MLTRVFGDIGMAERWERRRRRLLDRRRAAGIDG